MSDDHIEHFERHARDREVTMARIGEIDQRSEALNRARANLLLELREADSFGKRDQSDLAQAIDEFVTAKIAAAIDRRY